LYYYRLRITALGACDSIPDADKSNYNIGWSHELESLSVVAFDETVVIRHWAH
jgi:hypothetical protein